MKKRLYVDGMHCENCVKGLKSVLEEDLNGISVINVDLNGGYADVDLSEDLGFEEIAKAVAELDFELKKIEEV